MPPPQTEVVRIPFEEDPHQLARLGVLFHLDHDVGEQDEVSGAGPTPLHGFPVDVRDSGALLLTELFLFLRHLDEKQGVPVYETEEKPLGKYEHSGREHDRYKIFQLLAHRSSTRGGSGPGSPVRLSPSMRPKILFRTSAPWPRTSANSSP